ncbi:MAG: purine-nucleoside phosphorylase [Cytophagales bacterium]|nr:purine-nucleoside phosphorylase [Cytophagales bacterium]
MLAKIKEAVAYIQEKAPSFEPQYGIVLGTGLGALVKEVKVLYTLDYEDIPHFPVSTVEMHKGKLILGTIGDKNVVVMQGRFHYYEGYTMQEVVFPIRVMKLLGIQKLYVSNASGSLNPDYEVADLMIVEDHINLQYENPLRGANIDELGGRFPDMSEPYDLGMIEQAQTIAEEKGIKVHTGVYVSVPGPNLETKAEYRYLRIIGGDNVGMSTVPEIIVARHMEIPCFAISVITDIGVPERVKKIDIGEVIAAAYKAEPSMTELIKELIVRD